MQQEQWIPGKTYVPHYRIQKFRTVLRRIDAQFGDLAHQAGEAVEQELATAQQDVMAFLDGLKAHAIQYPERLFALLRKVKPILIVKEFALVTRFDDVQEVLARDVAHMRSVFRREDIPGRIVPFVRRQAANLVDAAGDELDVVKQLTRILPVRWIGDYFGCEPTSEEELAQWSSTIFQYLFTDLNNDPAVGKAAQEAAAATRGWLDATIAKRKANHFRAMTCWGAVSRCRVFKRRAWTTSTFGTTFLDW